MYVQQTDRTPGGPARREKGYTFVEVLIVVAVVAALSVGAFALFTGRGKTTEMTAMGQQIAQTVQTQQQLIYRGFRNAKISASELAGSLNSLLANHRFVESVESGDAACTAGGANKDGIVFDLNPEEFLTPEAAGEMQSIIHAAINNVFTDENGSPFDRSIDERSYEEVIEISSPQNTDKASDYLQESAAAIRVLPPNDEAKAYACLDSTA